MFEIVGTDIKLTRGDTAKIILSIKDKLGQPYSLISGDKVYFTVKTNNATTVNTFQRIITQFNTDGVAEIDIAHEDTSTLKYGTYVYDIQVNLSNGTISTVILPSKLEILSEVTFDG